MTTQTAGRRITDHAAGLVVLSMTSAFAVGDLVGGIVNGLRQLSDAAGRPPVGPHGHLGRPSGRSPVDEDPALEASSVDVLDAESDDAESSQAEPASN
jgi:hypothetical protein